MEFFPLVAVFLVETWFPSNTQIQSSQWIVYFYVFLHLPVKYQNLVWALKDKTTDKFESEKISDMRPCLCLNEKPHGIVCCPADFQGKQECSLIWGVLLLLSHQFLRLATRQGSRGPFRIWEAWLPRLQGTFRCIHTRICIWCIHTSKCIYCSRGWIMHQLRRW